LINSLGAWVTSLEKSIGLVGCEGIAGWEHSLSKTLLVSCGDHWWEALVTHPIIRLDRQLFTWLLYAVTTYSFIFIPTIESMDDSHATPKNLKETRTSLLNIGSRAVPSCLFLFGIFGYFHYADPDVTEISPKIYTVIVLIIIGMSNYLIKRMKK
jgi:hypothetical protein